MRKGVACCRRIEGRSWGTGFRLHEPSSSLLHKDFPDLQGSTSSVKHLRLSPQLPHFSSPCGPANTSTPSAGDPSSPHRGPLRLPLPPAPPTPPTGMPQPPPPTRRAPRPPKSRKTVSALSSKPRTTFSLPSASVSTKLSGTW